MINQKQSKNQIIHLIIILIVFTSIINIGVLDFNAFSYRNNNSLASNKNNNSLGLKLPKNSKIRVISTSYSTYKNGNAKTNAQNGNQVTTGSKIQSQTVKANNPNSDSNVPSTTMTTRQLIASLTTLSASSTLSTPTINYNTTTPFTITSNAQLASNSVSGVGTSSNPYILENFSITTSTTSAITIQNTTAYFILRNSNITLATTSFNGIYLINVTNADVTNNSLNGGGSGINEVKSLANTIFNNTIDNAQYGIGLTQTNSTTIELNTVNNSAVYGINTVASKLNTIDNNTENIAQDGIYLSSSNSTQLANNIANNNSLYGILFYPSTYYNNMTNNIADYNTQYGIWVESAYNNTMNSNTADHNGLAGFWIGLDSYNTFQNNMARNNTDYGFYFTGSNSHDTIVNNQAYNNTNGFEIRSSTNYNNFTNNIASQNNNTGFYLSSTLNNTLVGNIANSNTNSGFYIGSSQNITLQSNTAEYNSMGYDFETSSNNTVTTNLANANTNGFYVNQSSELNTLYNNSATGNTNGYFTWNSKYNNFIQNSATSNSYVGFFIASEFDSFTTNTATANAAPGFYLSGGSYNNTFNTNTATGNTNYGFDIIGSYNNTFTSNTAYSENIGFYLNSGSNTNMFTSNNGSSDNSGFELSSSSYNIFSSNVASQDNNLGFYLTLNSQYNTFSYNTAKSDYTYGFEADLGSIYNLFYHNTATSEHDGFITMASYNNFTFNTALNCNNGFYVQSSLYNTFVSNTATNAVTAGFYVGSSFNTFTNNNGTSDNVGFYLNQVNSNTFTSNIANNEIYGFELINSNSTTLTSNTVSSDSYGFGITASSSSNNLTNNIASNNGYGFFINSSSFIVLTGNTANSNTKDGFYLSYSTNSTLSLNTAVSNVNGFNLANSSNYNIITSNNATSNSNDGFLAQNSLYDNFTLNTALLDTYYGIYFSYQNNSIISSNTLNCILGVAYSSFNTISNNSVLEKYGYGIILNSANNNTFVSNNASYEGTYGFTIALSSNNTFINNIVNHDGSYGFYVSQSSNANNFTSNTASFDSYGFYVLQSNYELFSSNIANNNTNDGIFLSISVNDAFSSNTASSNVNGFYLDRSNYNTFISNTADSNTNDGFYLSISVNDSFSSNTATSNVNGFHLFSGSNYNTFTSNIADSNSNAGFYAQSSLYDNFTTNSATNEGSGTGYGFEFSSQSNSTVLNNILSSNGYGIDLATNSNHNTIANNIANPDSYSGFSLESSYYNTFTNNTQINANDGFYLSLANYNIFSNNIANSNTYGFFLTSSQYNSFNNNTANSNVNDGFAISNSASNTFTNNTANLDGVFGFWITNNAVRNIFINNSANNEGNILNVNTNAGFELDTSSGSNTFNNNSVTFDHYGFLISGVTSNVFNSNNASSNSYGFYLITSANSNNFTYNIASFNNISGFFINSSMYLVLSGNVANNNTQDGFYLGYSNYINLTSNTASYDVNGIDLVNGSYLNIISYNTLQSDSNPIYNEYTAGNVPSYNQFINNTINGYTKLNGVIIQSPTTNSYNNNVTIKYSDNLFTSFGPSPPSYQITTILLNGVANTTAISSGSVLILKPGLNNITIESKDGYGNVYTQQVIFTMIDTIAPVIVITSPINQTYIQNNWVILNYTVTELNGYTTKIFLDGSTNSTNWQPGYNITSLADGLHNITIVSTDTSGNIGMITYLFKIDAVSPVLTVVGPVQNDVYGSNMNNYNQPIKNMLVLAYANLSSSYTMYLNGSTTYFNQVNNSYDVPQTTGYYYSTFTLIDSAGFNSTYQIFYYFQVTPPVITISSPTNGTLTNQGSITLTYSISTLTWGSTIIYLNGVANTTSIASGSSVALGADGIYNLTIWASDGVGDWASAYVNFTLDSTGPIVSITSPVNNSYTSSSYLAFNYTITDNFDNYTYLIYMNGSSTPGSFVPSGTILPLSTDGLYNITIVATDWVGNVGTATVLFTFDTTKPVVTITNPNNTTLYSPSVNLTYSISELNGYTTKIYLDGSANSTNWQSGYIITGLIDGLHNITIVTTDLAGNVGNLTVMFTVDAIAPVISITSPVNQSFISSTSVFVNYSINELHNYTTLIYLDGSANSTNWQSGYKVTGLSGGLHNITIISTDQVGNVGKITYLFTVDTIAPVVTITSPTNTTYGSTSITMDYSVTDTNLNTIKLYEDGVLVTTYASGTVRSFANGYHNFTVVGIDKAGNSALVIVYFTVDTSLPSITFTSPTNNSFINSNTTAIDYSASNYNIMYVYVDSVTSNTTSVYNSGFTLTNISEGLHNVTITLVRTSTGNAITESLLFTVDTISPSVGLYGPPSGYPTPGYPETTGALTLSYVVSDINLKNVIIYTNGIANTTTMNPGFQLSLADGNYNITVVAYDLAGNVNSATSLFYVDTTAPVISVITPVNNSGYPGAFYINYSVSDLHLNYINVYEDGVNYGAVASGSIVSFADGNHNITIYAVDTTGHSSVKQVLFYTDTILPSVSITSPTNSGYNTSSITLTYTATDADLNTVIIYQDGVANTSALPSGTTLNFVDGNHNITVYAIDSAGNGFLETVLFYTETTSPTITITSPTSKGYNTGLITLTYNVTDSHLSSITIYTDGSASNNIAMPSGSQFYLAEGNHNITIYAVNAVGLSSVQTVLFFVDVTPPTLSFTNPTNTTYTTNSVSFSYSATDLHLSSVTLYVNGKVDTTISSGKAFTFPNGYYNVTLFAVDSVGNTAKLSVYFTVNTQSTTTTTTGTSGRTSSSISSSSSTQQGSSSSSTKKKGKNSPGFELETTLLLLFSVVPVIGFRRRKNKKS